MSTDTVREALNVHDDEDSAREKTFIRQIEELTAERDAAKEALATARNPLIERLFPPGAAKPSETTTGPYGQVVGARTDQIVAKQPVTLANFDQWSNSNIPIKCLDPVTTPSRFYDGRIKPSSPAMNQQSGIQGAMFELHRMLIEDCVDGVGVMGWARIYSTLIRCTWYPDPKDPILGTHSDPIQVHATDIAGKPHVADLGIYGTLLEVGKRQNAGLMVNAPTGMITLADSWITSTDPTAGAAINVGKAFTGKLAVRNVDITGTWKNGRSCFIPPGCQVVEWTNVRDNGRVLPLSEVQG